MSEGLETEVKPIHKATDYQYGSSVFRPKWEEGSAR